jgi:hypothetical protein
MKEAWEIELIKKIEKNCDLISDLFLKSINIRLDNLVFKQFDHFGAPFDYKKRVPEYDKKSLITDYLKKRGYISGMTDNILIKGFTYVKVISDDSIEIGHDIPNSKPYLIEFGALTEVQSVCNYYERV